MCPRQVRQVITLGSPFAGDPRATNAWKLYEFTSGHKVDDRERHMGSDRRPAAGADDGDLQPHRRHLPLAQLPEEDGRARPRTSKSKAAIAALAITRQPFTRSPIASRSRKASGSHSIAAAGAAWSIPIRIGDLFASPRLRGEAGICE